MNTKIFVILFALAGLLAIGCIGVATPNQQNSETLKVGMPLYIGEGPYFVAQEKGFFEAEGIQVEFVSFSDPTPLKSAFLGKKIDVYAFTVDAIAFDAAHGLPGKIFWLPTSSNGADGIIATNEIQSIEALKGKKIAFFEGTPSHFFLAHVLRENGLNQNDIQPINLEPDKAAQAFFAGEVEVAVSWEPWLSQAQSLTGAHILVSSQDTPDLILDAFLAREELFSQNSGILKKFVRGLRNGMAFSESNPREAAEIAAPYFEMTPEEYLEAVSVIRFLNETDNQELFAPNGRLEQVIIQAGKVWQEAGLIETPKTPQELIEPRIVNTLFQ
ncbi:ABC transporter substrate-binding protein [Candidatus Micrarchaeota archaeon]|nr:ABC transporter substrate-binding protein [Candidatus Micrarchaeota archaeon]MBU1930294.1 ABC transporter substrate-binding protein [Candidatus Micrarchaeota archaeon]